MGRSVVGRRALTVALGMLMLFVTAIGGPKLNQWAGAQHSKLLHTPTRGFVWLTQRRLMKRVTHCIPPALPTGGTLRLKSTVTVEIKIGADGKVEAARVTQGHPMLYQAVIGAVTKWTFKPMIVRGKANGFAGRLKFVLSTLKRPTKLGCLNGFSKNP